MTYRVIERRPNWPIGDPVALAAGAALLWLGLAAPDAAAEGPTCLSCTDEARRSRLEDFISNDPSRGRLESRLEGRPWIAQDWATLPVAVKPAEHALDMQASLQHLGTYTDRLTARKIEEAKALAAEGLVVPKAAPKGPVALDVWSKVEVAGLESDGGARRSTVGADFRVARSALVGVSAEVGGESSADAPALLHDTRLAAYFAVKPWAPVTLDARASWGESQLAHGVGMVTTQSAVMARVRGEFRYGGVKLAPTLSIAHGIDEAVPEVGGGAIEKSTIAVSPRVSRPFGLRGGRKIEPFLSLKSAIDISPTLGTTPGASETTHSVGGGVTLARPEAYSLSVTTDIEQPASSDERNVKGRLELKLPLR